MTISTLLAMWLHKNVQVMKLHKVKMTFEVNSKDTPVTRGCIGDGYCNLHMQSLDFWSLLCKLCGN